MSQKQIELFAYAKINLALAITGHRLDGYHELESVMQSIGLSDRIRITLTERGIDCSCGEWSGPENLAYQAAQVFLAGLNTTSGIRIEIEKNIPVQAGLGGGSADAATTLYALNHLFQEPYSLEQLKSLATRLGADVPFCLQGGTQWATGVGDVLKDLPLAPRIHLLIVKPWQGVNTAQAYRSFDEGSKFTHLSYEAWQKALASREAKALAPMLYNDLESASIKLLPEIARIKEALQEEEGCLGALMSGSGSAVFGMFQSSEQAQRVAGSWQDIQGKVWVTHTVERGHCHG